MRPISAISCKVLLCCLTAFITQQSFSQTSIVPYGSSWKYLDNGSDQGTAWRASGFNDAGWASGPAELGYGSAPATTVSYGPSASNKYITTYFRKTVNISNPLTFTNFTLNVRRDDGVVVYINGTERYRNNMPAATLYNTFASVNASDDGATPQTTTLLSSYFTAGNNVIAVEIHQSTLTSSDLVFDLELLGNNASASLINFSDVWKYRDNNTRTAGWETVGFNDGAWASGASELGYGDAPATTVSYGGNASTKYITTYFRKTFTVSGLSSYNNFTLNVIRDDGVIIYINGVEVARDNMPQGLPAHPRLASTDISGTGETTPITFSISPCYFVEGINTIAVEVHQNLATSDDLSFNLELIANTSGGTPALSRGPYLQMGSQTSITIRWRTTTMCLGRVEIGSSAGTYTIASEDESGCLKSEHIVTITGLSADTKYFYRISSTTGTVFEGGADNFFRTLPASNTTRKIRIAAFGDCGRSNATYQDENLANYQSYLSSNGIDAPDAWILLGDNAYNQGSDLEYSTKFFGIYGSSILKNHKLYPSPGNHDYANSSNNKSYRTMPYHSIFTVPENGEIGGVASNKQNFYSYDVGNIHFLSLDSYGIEPDGTDIRTSASSTLKTWIDADLAANTKKWIVAYWHHPPYTKTSHDSDAEADLTAIRQNFITYLESRGVDLVINGHSHGYERGYLLRNFTGLWTSFVPGTHAVSTSSATYTSNTTCPYVYNSSPANHGTVYVVAGSTGASGITQTNFGAYAFPYSVNDGGIFYFEVEDNRLDAKMLRRNGTIFDQFTIMKDAGLTRSYNAVVNSPVTLTASWPNDVSNYNWNTGANTREITVTPTVSGITNYTVSDNFGCITDQFSINASSTLPVSIQTYDVRLNKNKVEVSWSTPAETNNSYYTVERSVNGTDFIKIGKVNGAGTSVSLNRYVYTDLHPILGASYYRLSQTDYDGRTQYLGTKRIVYNKEKDFEATVVSAKNKTLVLQINLVKAGNYQLRAYDVQGNEWKNENIALTAGITRKEITLSQGVFIWEIRNDKGEVISQKIVIQ